MLSRCCAALLLLLAPALARGDHPAVHGMVVFGSGAVYVSHLPMFHPPHDYQVVAEIALSGDEEVLATYHREYGQGRLITVAPRPFDLKALIDGELSSFEGTLYQGHFERGGEAIGAVKATVKKLILGKPLSAERAPSNQFLAFGREGEYFLVHTLGGGPTYDALYRIPQPQHPISRCTRLHCPPVPEYGPIPDAQLPAVIGGNHRAASKHPRDTRIGWRWGSVVHVAQPFYVEYDELRP